MVRPKIARIGSTKKKQSKTIFETVSKISVLSTGIRLSCAHFVSRVHFKELWQPKPKGKKILKTRVPIK